MTASEIEEQEKQELYVLEAKADSLKGVVHFLGNRGWKIHSTTKVKEFLGLVLRDRPRFAMVCIDHPNASAAQLPKLVQNAFPHISMIVFIEGKSTASLNKLKNSNHEYALYPPLSGPAVERMILKIQKDRLKKETVFPEDYGNPSGSDNNNESSDGSVVIRGSASANQGSSAAEKARMTLQRFIATDDGDIGGTAYGGGAGAGQSTGTGLSGGAASTGAAGIGRAKRKSRLSLMSEQRNRRRNAPPFDFGPDGDWKLREEVESDDSDGDNDSDFDGERDERNESASGATKTHGTSRRSKKREAPTFEQDEIERKVRTKNSTLPEDSLIIKATESALDEAVIKRMKGGAVDRLSATTTVACIAVESSRFSGYMVAALAQNRKMDKTFITTVRARLIEFMREGVDEFTADDVQDLSLQEVEFEDWAMEHAEFLRKTIHDGQEIAVAFFPQKIDKTPLEVSTSQNMLMLNISELKGDATVEFDLYVHLPANNKYILYTRESQRLFSDQLERLKSKGIQKMHLRKENENDIRRYRVRNFLNDKITEHKNKKN